LAGGKNNPIYKDAEGALGAQLRELQARKRKLRPLAEDEIREGLKTKQDLDISLLQGELASAEDLEKEYKQLVERLAKQSSAVNEDSIDLEAAMAQVKVLKEKIGKIEADMDDIEMEMSGQSPVTPLDEAWITYPTIGRKQVMATWGAGLGAFG